MRDDTRNVRVLFWTGWRGWRLNLKLCVDKALYDVLFIHIIFKNHYKQLLLLLKYLWHVNLGGRGGGRNWFNNIRSSQFKNHLLPVEELAMSVMYNVCMCVWYGYIVRGKN